MNEHINILWLDFKDTLDKCIDGEVVYIGSMLYDYFTQDLNIKPEYDEINKKFPIYVVKSDTFHFEIYPR